MAETLRALVLIGMNFSAVEFVKAIVEKNRLKRPSYAAPFPRGAVTVPSVLNDKTIVRKIGRIALFGAVELSY